MDVRQYIKDNHENLGLSYDNWQNHFARMGIKCSAANARKIILELGLKPSYGQKNRQQREKEAKAKMQQM